MTEAPFWSVLAHVTLSHVPWSNVHVNAAERPEIAAVFSGPAVITAAVEAIKQKNVVLSYPRYIKRRIRKCEVPLIHHVSKLMKRCSSTLNKYSHRLEGARNILLN